MDRYYMENDKPTFQTIREYLHASGHRPLGDSPIPDPFSVSCAEVQAQLSTFTQTPEQLGHAQFTKIGTHMLECPTCRTRFLELSNSKK